MHEEDYGILWKHTDRRLPDTPEVRRSRRLVVSSISTVENYEYGFFWYLYQDGNIQFEIKLTGILSLGALQPGEKPKYGTLIAPQLYAPNHQHFFNVRLDFDLDGTANTVYQVDVVPTTRAPRQPVRERLPRAGDAAEDREAGAGQPQPGDGAHLEDRQPAREERRRRAGRLQVPARRQRLPVRLAERLVAQAGRVRQPPRLGDALPRGREATAPATTPTRASGGDGLIRWTEQDRPIEDTDVVLWYTFGHTHIPRPEDYPVMPTAYIGFMLKPAGFFALNPANDVPPSEKKGEKKSCCSG